MKESARYIIIHCSDSLFGNAATITKWHIQKGWRTIGYHYVILNGKFSDKIINRRFDGLIETGRGIDEDSIIESNEIGSHTSSFNNNVGICLVGESGRFTVKQLNALKKEIIELKRQFPEALVIQHSDLNKEKHYCAGLSKQYMEMLNKL